MRLGPFWWLAPTEYGFHKSQSTQRPSRPPQTRITVRSRATGGSSAYAPCQGKRAAAPAARAVLITSRRLASGNGERSCISPAFPPGLVSKANVAAFRAQRQNGGREHMRISGMVQTYEGGCHCGRIRFRIRADLAAPAI